MTIRTALAGEEREHLAVRRVAPDRRVGWRRRRCSPGRASRARTARAALAASTAAPIAARSRLRGYECPTVRNVARPSGMPASRRSVRRWNSTPVVGQPVGHLPERGRPAADHPLVVVVERPDAVPGDVEHVAAEDAEAEAQQHVEVASAQLARSPLAGKCWAYLPTRTGVTAIRRQRCRAGRSSRRGRSTWRGGGPTRCCRGARGTAGRAVRERCVVAAASSTTSTRARRRHRRAAAPDTARCQRARRRPGASNPSRSGGGRHASLT